ncbi:hypothetical protein L873DRAFT_1811033 [Choiromyces venosus 120613-1]|uniref:Uncharacterized protein n=1 Tax=Choiromyces venosus 120613-1 TaxID=1336337 RepID=A0A3N4JEJ4_9PEZI|nr:hypothetical protein L873DRAFT_1811033 [Choiromyces venosus 120613-1]
MVVVVVVVIVMVESCGELWLWLRPLTQDLISPPVSLGRSETVKFVSRHAKPVLEGFEFL